MMVARFTGDIPQNVNFALKAEVARTFLDSVGIPYQSAHSDKQLSPADVGDIARPYTVQIKCYKAPAVGSSGHAIDVTKINLAPNKRGTTADFQPMSDFCGTKAIKVALSDGWGGNYWRRITRAEFEDEASKCPNIIETRYTDGKFNPEKQIADIEGLITQKFDAIV